MKKKVAALVPSRAPRMLVRDQICGMDEVEVSVQHAALSRLELVRKGPHEAHKACKEVDPLPSMAKRSLESPCGLNIQQ